MKFQGIIFSLLLIGLFVIAFLNASLILSADNSPNQTIANDPALTAYAGVLNTTLESSYPDANASEGAISDSPITLSSGSGGIIIDAISGIWKTIKRAPIEIYQLTAGLIFTKIFGDAQYAIVFSVLAGMLIIAIVLAVWKLVSQGEGGS